MRALIATAMYPTAERPAFGTFVRTQVEALRGIGVEAEPFVLAGRNRKAMYAVAVRGLRRRLASEPAVDLVHAHYGLVGAVARTQWRVPVVVTFHGDDLLGTVGPDGRHLPVSRAIAAGGRLVARLADAVIVQSPQMAEVVPRRDHVFVIPHEVDLDLFHPEPQGAARAALGLHPTRRYVLFAASPDIPVKRFPLARDAVAQVRRQLPDVELCVIHREAQPRLARFMNACDALVFTSYQEGSPNIVKQAMACNLPIVSTRVGDVVEVVGDTAGCAVVEPTVGAVAEGLRAVLEEPRRTRGRVRVHHLRPDLVAERVRHVYEQACSRRPALAARGA